MADGRTEETVLADRVATIHASANERQGSSKNWPLIGSVGAFAVLLIGFVFWTFGGGGAASNADRFLPSEAVTSEDSRNSKSSLFGDTDFVAPPPEPNREVEALKAQIAALAASLEENRPTGELPEEYKVEMAKMRQQMTDMQAGFEEEISTYKTYIGQLEARMESSTRLPPRPVSLEDSKWVRAQQLNSGDEKGEAARRAAPSMVFDGSARDDEKEEDEKLIIERFGRTFPASEDLTPPPPQ